MTYIINAYSRNCKGESSLLASCTARKHPIEKARSLARRNKPACHPTVGSTVVYVKKDGKTIAVVQSWRDREIQVKEL